MMNREFLLSILNKMKKGLLNEEKEKNYLEDLYIKVYKENLKTYNHLKDLTILKHDVLMAEIYDNAEIIFYYETKENIVEKENVSVKVKRHTKISDYELHLTEDGLALYAPYKM